MSISFHWSIAAVKTLLSVEGIPMSISFHWSIAAVKTLLSVEGIITAGRTLRVTGKDFQ
jgi:hypothetical protein